MPKMDKKLKFLFVWQVRISDLLFWIGPVKMLEGKSGLLVFPPKIKQKKEQYSSDLEKKSKPKNSTYKFPGKEILQYISLFD